MGKHFTNDYWTDERKQQLRELMAQKPFDVVKVSRIMHRPVFSIVAMMRFLEREDAYILRTEIQDGVKVTYYAPAYAVGVSPQLSAISGAHDE